MGWVVGALLSILGSIASNLGVNVQKYSFIRQAERPLAQRTSHWKDSRWLFGLALVIFGSLGDFAALSMVAQSIVAPLASTTLVTNVLFAHFWLHESVGRRELIGTALIIVGSTLAVAFGDHASRHYTNEYLVSLISGGAFIFYVIVVVLLCFSGLSLHRRVTPIKKQLVEAIRRYETAFDQGNAEAAGWEDELIARLEHEYKRWEKIHPFALCALSGSFGAQSVLFGKCFAELLSTSVQGDNQLVNIFPYVALIGMGMTVFCQLHFLAIALNYFDATYVIPVFQCFFITVSTLGGALYFREVYNFSAGETFAFISGLLITLAGVAVLSTRKMGKRRNMQRIATQEQEPIAMQTAAGSRERGNVGLSAYAIAEGDENEETGEMLGPDYMYTYGDGQNDPLYRRRLINAAAARAMLAPYSTEVEKGDEPSLVPSVVTLPLPVMASGAVVAPIMPTDDDDSPLSPKEIEMKEYGSSIKRSETPSPTPSMPQLKDSARLPPFAEQAEAESRELADVHHTVTDTQQELADKLAQLRQKDAAQSSKPQDEPLLSAASSSASSLPSSSSSSFESSVAGPIPLLPASSSRPIPPDLNAAIESDLEYLNRQDDELAKVPHPQSAAATQLLRRHKSLIAHAQVQQARMERENQEMRAAAGVSSSPSIPPSVSRRTSLQSSSSSLSDGSGSSRPSSRPSTPRSAYARARSLSRTTTPPHPPPKAATPSVSDDRSDASRSRRGSLTGNVRVGASAVFSGAVIDDAQDLPDIDDDTQLSRLTRLSTVGHWVGGLHAQMPVVGGVAQAILQAAELQTLMDEEEANTMRQQQQERQRLQQRTTPTQPDSKQVATTASDLTGSAALPETRIDMPGNSVQSTPPHLQSQLPAAALATVRPRPVSPTKPIEFHDDYDPFTTQPTSRLLGARDSVAASLHAREPNLHSPTSAFNTLRPSTHKETELDQQQTAHDATHDSQRRRDEMVSQLGDRRPVTVTVTDSNTGISFAPLTSTHHHPLEPTQHRTQELSSPPAVWPSSDAPIAIAIAATASTASSSTSNSNSTSASASAVSMPSRSPSSYSRPDPDPDSDPSA